MQAAALELPHLHRRWLIRRASLGECADVMTSLDAGCALLLALCYNAVVTQVSDLTQYLPRVLEGCYTHHLILRRLHHRTGSQSRVTMDKEG